MGYMLDEKGNMKYYVEGNEPMTTADMAAAQSQIAGQRMLNQGKAPTPVNTPVPTKVAPPQPQQKSAGLLDRIGGFLGNNSDMLNKIGAGYFALSQDPRMQQFGMQQIDQMNKLKAAKAQANKTVAMLRAQGEDKLADMIEKNPSIAKEALTQWLQQKYGRQSGIKTSEVKIDPATGQMFVIKTDPNTGEVTRTNVEGAVGETPSARTARESSARLSEGDIEAGYDLGAEYFSKYENIRSQIRQYDQAIAAMDKGADSGIIKQFLPAFDNATSQLRQAANNLGITVINSATFGALSEKELSLALSTGLDLSLPPDQLRQQAIDKRDAQAKMAAELAKKAREAQSMGRKAFIDMYTQKAGDSADLGTKNLNIDKATQSIFDKADAIIGK